jgi:Zn ribbon nucleic-acid-binding protein
MLVPIPAGMKYSVTATGAVLKWVRCDACGVEYQYKLQRKARGEGRSILFLDEEGALSRASSSASAELHYKLQHGVDVVPCPACGHVQQRMFRKARREHRRWMLTLGLVLTCLSPPLALAGLVIGTAVHRAMSNPVQGGDQGGNEAVEIAVVLGGPGAFLVLGVGLMAAKFVSAWRYDPNAEDEEVRKKRVRSAPSCGKRWVRRARPISHRPNAEGEADRLRRLR